jgi:hypothetical protein
MIVRDTNANIQVNARGFPSAAASYDYYTYYHQIFCAPVDVSIGCAPATPLGSRREFYRSSNLFVTLTSNTITFPKWMKGLNFHMYYFVLGDASNPVNLDVPTVSGLTKDVEEFGPNNNAQFVARMMYHGIFTITTNQAAVITFPTTSVYPANVNTAYLFLEQTGGIGKRAWYTITGPTNTDPFGTSRTLTTTDTMLATIGGQTITFGAAHQYLHIRITWYCIGDTSLGAISNGAQSGTQMTLDNFPYIRSGSSSASSTLMYSTTIFPTGTAAVYTLTSATLPNNIVTTRLYLEEVARID